MLACSKVVFYNSGTIYVLQTLKNKSQTTRNTGHLMRRTKAEALKTREYLMFSALDVFYERGVSRASLNEIAQNAGVTRGALYWHFKNKEDLFDALFQHLFQDISQELQEDIQKDTPDLWVNFQRSLIDMVHRVQHNDAHHKFCNILHLKCEHTKQNQSITLLMRNYSDMWNTLLTSAVSACVKQKSLPENLDIPLAVLFIQSTVTGLLHTWLAQSEKFDLSKVAEPQIVTCLNALVHAPTLLKRA